MSRNLGRLLLASLFLLAPFLRGLPAGGAESVPREKDFAFKVVERNSRAIALLGDNIFYFAELGMQEFETARLLTHVLEQAGFKVERGISGMPTGFLATYGSGQPVIAMHTEYDATPGNSQTPGVPDHKPLVEGAPGHAEGHNVNAAVMIGAAFAIKKAMDEFKLKGTLKVIGGPAEEQLIPRPYFAMATLETSTSLFIRTSVRIQGPNMASDNMPLSRPSSRSKGRVPSPLKRPGRGAMRWMPPSS